MSTSRLKRVVVGMQIFSDACILGVISVLLWPARIPTTVIAPVLTNSSAASAPQSAPNTGVEAIVAADIFSSTRAEAPAAHSAQPAPAASSAVSGPLLFGVLMGEHPAALMQLDAHSAGAQLYHEGESAGSYRVERINNSSVVVSGPHGQVTVHLTKTSGQPN
jgi:hypothetical protein